MTDHSKVRRFVGVDAHSDHCNLACLRRQGEFCLEVEVATRAEDLREVVSGLRKPVWLSVESSSMAPFVAYALEAAVDRVIVNETRENRWISRNEKKGDREDARRLARQLRMNEYKEVHLPRRSRRGIRELSRLLQKSTADTTRLKNRIKSKFRESGLPVSGSAVYSGEGRQIYLTKLRRSNARFMAEVIYGSLDAAEEARDRIFRRLCDLLRNHREYKLLKGVPGVGPRTAAIMVAVIDTPWRFETKRRLWKYAGLAICSPWSGRADKAHPRPAKTGNRLLKHAAMTAARHAVRGSSRFAAHYERMISGGSTKAMALKTIARNILATALAIWKSGIPYRDGY